jgi:chromosomal replication initiation ATPase DnaA
VEYSIKNPYYLPGNVVNKQEIISIISNALEISLEDIYRESNKKELVDARRIIYYEFYRKGVPISKIPEITNIPRKRSLVSSSIDRYLERIRYDSEFKRKVQKFNDYLETQQIKRNYILLWKEPIDIMKENQNSL